MKLTFFSSAILLCLAAPGVTQAQGVSKLQSPIPGTALLSKLQPRRDRTDVLPQLTPSEQQQLRSAASSGSLQTLPYWQGSFSINGTEYNYTIVGGNPQSGGTTTIKTVIIPIKLTIPDYTLDGSTPIILDATALVPQILASPIFQTSNYITGYQQFGDAMLRAEFPDATPGWHTVLAPTVGPTLDITATPGSVTVFQAKNGNVLANVIDDHIIDGPILSMVRGDVFPPDEYPIFVTYNAVEHDAFGYHAAGFQSGQTREQVFAYTSWLVGVDDLLTIPSPDAATISHEVAETLHDAFNGNLSSLTLLWGDPFGGNRCFQNYIEVGDAVEDAPAKVQLHEQVVGFGSQAHVYTLQNEATLPWFERQSPSSALAATYSFPDIWVLNTPAPYTCVQ